MDDLRNLKNKWVENKEFNSQEVNFSAKLVNVGETPIENKNGTRFYPATFTVLVGGVLTNFTGAMYEKTLNNLNETGGPKYGEEYLCRASVTNDEIALAKKENRNFNIFMTVSQLQGGERATSDAFGFSSNDSFKTTPAEAKESLTPGNGAF